MIDLPSIPSKTEYLIMILLINMDNIEQYGLELVSNSQGQLKKGGIYVLLHRLEGKGFVKSRLKDREANARGLPKRLYKVTSEGRRAIDSIQSFGL